MRHDARDDIRGFTVAANAAWQEYQRQVGSLTGLQEVQIERAFRAGFHAAIRATGGAVRRLPLD